MASTAEQLLEQLLKKGLKQGAQKSAAKGVQATLTRLLEQRFGALDTEAKAQVAAGTPEDLDRWLDRVITAESLDVIFADDPD